MVRFWTLEAIAHGAEVVSYFRWRQAPFAQEQMHAGLLRPDRTDDVAAAEVRAVAAELPGLAQFLPAANSRSSAPVALIFDYSAEWITATQPQGEGFSALRATFEWYVALRRLGLDVDIVSSATGLDDYALVVVPCLPVVSTSFVNSLQRSRAQVVFGPRCGSKTENFSIPAELPPGLLQALIPLRVVRVESLRGDLVEFGADFEVRHWLEHIDTALAAELRLLDGRGILHRHARYRYLAAAIDGSMLRRVLASAALEAGIAVQELPEGLRLRRCGPVHFAFNHGSTMCSLGGLVPANARFLLGSDELGAAGVAAWTIDS
jgi:beta-galactosidase